MDNYKLRFPNSIAYLINKETLTERFREIFCLPNYMMFSKGKQFMTALGIIAFYSLSCFYFHQDSSLAGTL